VYRTFRPTFLVAFLAVALLLSGSLDLTTASAAPVTGREQGTSLHDGFTRDEAIDVLDQARSRLRPDTRRLRARQPVGRGSSTELTLTLRDLFLARSALTGADRRAADRILARPGAAAVTDPNTDPLATPERACSANFCVHYRSAGLPGGATATQVQNTLSTLEHVHAYETGTLGYRPPVADTPALPSTDNPDSRFDVFLTDLSQEGLYGYCAPDHQQPALTGQAAAFCVLDNDYAYAEYGAAPLNSLRATAAHEFFHTIQFAYDVNEDIWFMEGTATWVEDEVYDSINDNYQYLQESAIRQPRRALDYSVGMHLYGSFLFFKYAAERLRDRNVVRSFWEYADASQDRYSLQAIRAVLHARKTDWAGFFSVFGSWNALPGRTYSEGTYYPAPAFTQSRTLSTRSSGARSTGWRTVTLPHLSHASVRAVPPADRSPRTSLLVEVKVPDPRRGGTALVQRRYRNGTVSHSLLRLDGAGTGRLLMRFDRRLLASVSVVLSNTSPVMRDCGRVATSYGGPLYSCYGRGYYDLGQNFAVRMTVR
jgi:hypothetical protein